MNHCMKAKGHNEPLPVDVIIEPPVKESPTEIIQVKREKRETL